MSSILNDVKAYIPISVDCYDFDVDLIICINGVLGILPQILEDLSTPLSITSASDTWEQFNLKPSELVFARSYVGMKVKLLFDPPQNATVLNALKELVSEYEWRLNDASLPT